MVSRYALSVPIRIAALRKLCDPFVGSCWRGLDRPLTVDEIRGTPQRPPIGDNEIRPGKNRAARKQHAGRIHWFWINGWTDPISIDVGIPGMCYVAWPILDGNHRFAAAILRGDPYIMTDCSGATSILDTLLWKGKLR